uniref:Uncharacterized protein n=1 Tax=Magallana gigas TaxID=29159 RepID=A0A8W8MFL9_MAGGI
MNNGIKMRWFWRKVNGRITRFLSRATQRLTQENEKPITALYLVLPSSVIPMTLFVSYYFTPIDYCLDKLKKKYGYENEDQKHSVDADTRTLLQGVVDDLQETKLFTMYYPSLELEVYPCKGHDIVVNLTQTTNGLSTRRVLAVGVPDYITSSSPSGTASPPYPRWSFKLLSDGTLRNVGNYMAGGKTYCMKKLKRNYHVYELQQERAMHSQMERLKLMLCCLFHCFDPNLETVYNRAGGIRKWPFNYFNYDFFWAYSIKSELDKGQPISPKWREWVSSYCVVSPVESQLKYLPSDKLNQVPLVFQSVLIPLNKDKVWDFADPKSDKAVGRQAQHFLKSFGLYRQSTCLRSLASPRTDIFDLH